MTKACWRPCRSSQPPSGLASPPGVLPSCMSVNIQVSNGLRTCAMRRQQGLICNHLLVVSIAQAVSYHMILPLFPVDRYVRSSTMAVRLVQPPPVCSGTTPSPNDGGDSRYSLRPRATGRGSVGQRTPTPDRSKKEGLTRAAATVIPGHLFMPTIRSTCRLRMHLQ